MTDEFRSFMKAAGVPPPLDLVVDGTLRRFHVEGDNAGTQNGWYCLYDDPPVGFFGCWKRGISKNWLGRPVATLTVAEKKEYRDKIRILHAERKRLQEEVHAEARKRAAEILESAEAAQANHPYLASKGIQSHGVRYLRGSLVLPLRDTKGILHGLQFIDPCGNKRFLTGTKKLGAYFLLGSSDRIPGICEGYATGASIYEATGQAVAVAFDAGNILAVAKALCVEFPGQKPTIYGDQDSWTKGNPGATKALEAATAMGGFLALPSFKDTAEQPTDFNDLHRLEGLEEVRRQLKEARLPVDNQGKPTEALEVLRGSSVKIGPIEWLWPGWIASGKLHVLAGAPGTGKTTLALALGAILSTGGQWPDETQAPKADVAIWSGEDDPADTLVPRLIAAGANLNRCHIIRDIISGEMRRPFDPSQDIPHLANFLRKNPTVKLLIVDPVVSAVAGDSHKNTEVRRNLQPLVDLAASCNCAVLGITHFSKGTTGRDPLERVTGSIAFGALARVVFAVAKLANNEDGRRLFARAKSNIGPDSGGWHYQLNKYELVDYAGVITSKVSWCGAVEGSARELLDTAETTEDRKAKTAKGEAKDFLLDILADGPVAAEQIISRAKAIGISGRTLNRAKAELKVVSIKPSMDEGWRWSLAPKDAIKAEERHKK